MRAAFAGALGKAMEVGKGVANAAVNRVRAELEKPMNIGRFRIKLVRLLAEGGYSYVYLAQDLDNGDMYACKRVLAHDKETLDLAQQEIDVMRSIPPHPLIVQCLASSSVRSSEKPNETEVYMLLELCSGGHLVEIIERRAGRKFTPAELLPIFHQVCLSVAHLHSQMPPIAHRDLKVENVIRSENGDYKLCDFGSCTTRAKRYMNRAEMLEEEERIQRFSTMMYRAPEMCDMYRKDLINEKVDIWALGCVLYTMVFFKHPFQDAGPLAIINAKFNIPEVCPHPEYINDLIRFLLTQDPATRPDIYAVIDRVETLMKENNATSLPVRSRIPLPPLVRPSDSAPARSESPPATQPTQSIPPTITFPQESPPTTTTTTTSSAAPPPLPRVPSAKPAPAAGGLFAMVDWIDTSSTGATTSSPSSSVPSRSSSAPPPSAPARAPSPPAAQASTPKTAVAGGNNNGDLFDLLDWSTPSSASAPVRTHSGIALAKTESGTQRTTLANLGGGGGGGTNSKPTPTIDLFGDSSFGTLAPSGGSGVVLRDTNNNSPAAAAAGKASSSSSPTGGPGVMLGKPPSSSSPAPSNSSSTDSNADLLNSLTWGGPQARNTYSPSGFNWSIPSPQQQQQGSKPATATNAFGNAATMPMAPMPIGLQQQQQQQHQQGHVSPMNPMMGQMGMTPMSFMGMQNPQQQQQARMGYGPSPTPPPPPPQIPGHMQQQPFLNGHFRPMPQSMSPVPPMQQSKPADLESFMESQLKGLSFK
mmetsp:Transcript_17788/g.29455  ORF Transcript_17788/g.29455 Transcript_17788/m.29455 type:complete len:758 (-) Transcript_17788:78-2351(-)